MPPKRQTAQPSGAKKVGRKVRKAVAKKAMPRRTKRSY